MNVYAGYCSVSSACINVYKYAQKRMFAAEITKKTQNKKDSECILSNNQCVIFVAVILFISYIKKQTTVLFISVE